MNHFKRILKLDLPKGQSAFLWGARKTGKTTLLKDIFPNAITYNFLKSDLFITPIQQ
jgi:transcription termination factor Rho